MDRLEHKRQRRTKRKLRGRRYILGVVDCPRLSIYKSNYYLYIQAIDDTSGYTMASLSSAHGDMKKQRQNVTNAYLFGKKFGEMLKKKKIDRAVFDRNGNLYHGLIKAVADGIRDTSIAF